MFSIRSLYKIGPGPSSSHTMGPANAIKYILEKYSDIQEITMYFYGSLALTGKGHLSDYIADKLLSNITHTIVFDIDTPTKHPNTMKFDIVLDDNSKISETIISVGGGIIEVEGIDSNSLYKDVYPHSNFKEIAEYCLLNNLSLVDYIHQFEDANIDTYIEDIYQQMMICVNNGLSKTGVLPGSLQVERKAKKIYECQHANEPQSIKEKRLVMAYAFAAAEENASGNDIVTAPTCGSCGIIPSLVKYLEPEYDHQKIIEGLEIAGLIGLLVKHNASIAGAECGCQAEIGTASSMGAALVTYLYGGDINKIARASEIAMEHSLGLTCDPIEGYVQIPCIERNAMYALRTLEASSLAMFIDDSANKISFDEVVKTMYQTGLDLQRGYRETSMGGLAKLFSHSK